MLVKIEEIQDPAGLQLNEPIEAEVLAEALTDSDGFSFVSATRLAVSFRRVSGRVHVTGHFDATVTAPCKRCTKDVTLTVPVDFALRMIPEGQAKEEDEDELLAPRSKRRAPAGRSVKQDDGEAKTAGTFELDEVDAEPFDGKTIDLDPIVREQVLLALPLSVVCREDCKGLCTTCGQDLNEKDCGHSGLKEVDVRLAKLKDIKLIH